MRPRNGFFRAALLLAVTLAVVSCDRKAAESPSTDFSQWITAYSGGILERDSPIRIIFSIPVSATKAADMSQEELDNLFSFSPKLAGTARISGKDGIEFIPDDGQMKPGTVYSASFSLGEIADTGNSGLDVFKFGFSTRRKEVSMTLGGVCIREESPTVAEVTGTLSFSGSASEEEARKMLGISYPGGTAQVAFLPTDNPRSMQFVISGLTMDKEARQLKVRLEGSKAGYSSSQEETIQIPDTCSFRVISSRILESAEPCVEVRFSRPLDSADDPTGMFVLDNSGNTIIKIENNLARIFYESISRSPGNTIELTVASGVRSADGATLGADYVKTLKTEGLKPAVEIPLTGNVLPDPEQLILPLRAVNLAAVDVSVVKIYGSNILSFLQSSSLDEQGELRRFGRMVCRKTLRLDTDPSKDLHQWQDFSIDLSGLFRQERDAIYRIRLSFKQDYSLYNSTGDTASPSLGGKNGGADKSGVGLVYLASEEISPEEELVWDEPYPYYYESFYDWSSYRWQDRDNPLTPSYYMVSDRFPVRNLMTSDLGIIAKSSGDGILHVAVSNLLSAEPVKGAAVTLYNYQLQKVGEGTTDADGTVHISLQGTPFAVKAVSGNSTSYLKVTEGTEKSVSRFDVGGVKLTDGMKTFIYGERGVWRPGDTLFVSLMVDDRDGRIPDNHPVAMELYTPLGQFHTKMIDSRGTDGLYCFRIPTRVSDPTGTWNAYFKIGGSTFHKALQVETIQPNRLKIRLSPDSGILKAGEQTRFALKCNWLAGPVAAGLDARVEMVLGSAGSTFKGYDGYVFSDPSSSFSTAVLPLLETRLDGAGEYAGEVKVPAMDQAPGMLEARVVSKVQEEGGNESITSSTMLYSPYTGYVGVKLPSAQEGYLETDKDYEFQVATVDADGKALVGHEIEYRVFKLDWSWWWECRPEEVREYVNGTGVKPVMTGKFTSTEKPYGIPFRVNYPEWGRYLVYVKDLSSGHATGGIVMADWPDYYGRSDKKDPNALTMLSFSTDKKEYRVGEKCTVYIPAARDARALVSVETGRKVVAMDWVQTDAEREVPYRLVVTQEMEPNFYVHVTLLQKHGNTGNDLPMRLYGVQPVGVVDEGSRLQPVIRMPEAVRPLEEFEVRVSEVGGKGMAYTLAIVDEGLLDLTGFRTPDPWGTMYAREALGVKTWDLYDDVVGSFGGRFPSMGGIGGDGVINKDSKQDNRFNPVVKFLGPFTYSGKENVHKVTLPMYVGSVRVMVVAGKDGAYGNAEKTVPVRTPLMILPTVPAVLAPGERFNLPVNVFAMEDGVRDVEVAVEVSGPAETSSARTGIRFSAAGDTLVAFSLNTADYEGVAEIKITARGGGYVASEVVKVPVRNPNPFITRVMSAEMAAGDSAKFDFGPIEEGTSWLTLTSFPSIDFNGCVKAMAAYPYDCTEQLAAKGITMLSLTGLVSDSVKKEIEDNIPDILSALYERQLPDGGFPLWGGESNADEWVTSMVGRVFVLASAQGYSVNSGVYKAWLNFQKRSVRNYRFDPAYGAYALVQADRLFSLAMAASPEEGAMNRLKETAGLPTFAAWRLAGAYALSGKTPVAATMIEELNSSGGASGSASGGASGAGSGGISGVASGSASGQAGFDPLTFGSGIRDLAIVVETLAAADQTGPAIAQALTLAREFNKSGYGVSQNTAFCAAAMSRLAARTGTGALKAEVSSGSAREGMEKRTVEQATPMFTQQLNPAYETAKVKNLSRNRLYATVVASSRPAAGSKVAAAASGIGLGISWTDLDGNPVNPSKLSQGTEFKAIISVVNKSSTEGLSSLVLDFPIASGWEIFNERMFGAGWSECRNADIRDDGAIFYFDLPKGARQDFTIRLRAAYQGDFYLPSTSCSAMYDPSKEAHTASGTVSVIR